MSATQSISLRRLFRRLLLAVFVSPTVLQALPNSSTQMHFSDGWQAYESGDYAAAAAVWRALAENGHVNAQTNLGFMYDYGTGVPQDHRLAARWYRAAALQGSAAAQYNLSLLIAEGHAPALGGRSARYWLEKAAAQGFEDARRSIAGSGGANNQDPDGATGLPRAGAGETAAGLEQTEAHSVDIPVSIGTAWPVASGYAVTNHHIIEGKKQVVLVNRHGEELPAKVVASDAENDIAFLNIGNPHHLPPALPLSSRNAPLGASVFTIGFPRIDVMGKSPKLSQGIISGANGLRDDPSSYQISVPIQKGNSGGPLINMRGEVVGMITSMLGTTDAGNGPAQPIPNINYALKTDVIRQFLKRLSAPEQGISELHPATGDLESLAARVKDSVLIVMAE